MVRSRRYPAQTITDSASVIVCAGYLLANTLAQAESRLHSLERAATGIDHHVNTDKTEYTCLNQTGDISILNGSSLKLKDKFAYHGIRVSSTEKDIKTRLAKAWKDVDRLSVIWKSDLTDKIRSQFFFQASVVSILQYGCTTWTLNKRKEKKLDSNYARMLRAIMNKSCKQHPTKQQLYDHQPPITKTIQVRRTRYAGHSWRSKYELISDILLWALSHGRAKAWRSARTALSWYRV